MMPDHSDRRHLGNFPCSSHCLTSLEPLDGTESDTTPISGYPEHFPERSENALCDSLILLAEAFARTMAFRPLIWFPTGKRFFSFLARYADPLPALSPMNAHEISGASGQAGRGGRPADPSGHSLSGLMGLNPSPACEIMRIEASSRRQPTKPAPWGSTRAWGS